MSEADDKFASDAVKRKVNMKKFLMTLALGGFALGASAQYQLPNGDFEGTWNSVTGKVKTGLITSETQTCKVPNHWNSFMDCDGSYQIFARGVQVGKSSEKRPGSTGTTSVKIMSRNTFASVLAQGNLTTGRVYAGSMDPSNEGNHNYTDINNSKYGQKFYGRPDAVSVWVKYESGREGGPNNEDLARICAILHDNYKYQDPTTNSKIIEHKIGSAELNYAPTNGWVEKIIPFEYVSGSKGTEKPSYILMTMTTNKTPGNGSVGDVVYIDDISMVYYHALLDLKYDGKTVSGFSEKTLSYDLSDVVYDASKLSYKEKGKGATVEKNYNKEAGVLSITVKGNDFSENPASVTTYTVQFAKQADKAVEYTNGLSVNVNEEVTPPQLTTYSVVTKADKSISLVLKNFMLGSGEDAIPVGNIVLDNVTVKGNHYTTNKVILISAGDDPNYSEEDWYGPILGEVPVKLDGTLHDGRLDATIEIDMFATLKQVIKVVLAPLYEATPAKALTIPADGLGNVTFNRTFYKGWNTFVAPFPVTKAQLGCEKVNALVEISNSSSWLKFDDVAGETLEANKPYLLYYSANTPEPVKFYYGGEVRSTTSEVKTTVTGQDGAKVSMMGNYTPNFTGVVGNYLLTDRSGKDEIAKAGAGSKVDATKCYFTFENVANPAALSVKFGGDVTGMGNVVAEETAPRANGVYNLQGVKLSNGSVEGLPAGLYIVNGRKVLVK